MRNMTVARRTGSRGGAPAIETGTLARAVTILEAVDRGARTYTDVVRATGFARTTTHRLIKHLLELELLSYRGGFGFELGPRFVRLGVGATRRPSLMELARPSIERLATLTGESAQLYVISGRHRLCVDSVESGEELRTIVPVGSTLPITAGSAGKAFMAWLPEPDRGALARKAKRLTEQTPVGDALERELVSIRRRGWSSSSGERTAGVGSVSAPILDGDQVAAVVSISGPTSRLGRVSAKRHVRAVVAAAHEIERALGVFPS